MLIAKFYDVFVEREFISMKLNWENFSETFESTENIKIDNKGKKLFFSDWKSSSAMPQMWGLEEWAINHQFLCFLCHFTRKTLLGYVEKDDESFVNNASMWKLFLLGIHIPLPFNGNLIDLDSRTRTSYVDYKRSKSQNKDTNSLRTR